MATTFCCGAECGILAIGAAPGAGILRHWDIVTGTPTIVTGRGGVGKAYNFVPAGAQIRLVKNLAGSPTSYTARFAVRFNTALPTANCNIALFFPAAGSNATVRFRTGTNDLIPALAGTSTGATGFAVTTGVWYIVAMKCDVSGTTRTVSAQIKVAGGTYTDCGTVSAGATASTLATFWVGGNVLATDTPTADVDIDDILLDSDTANYPLAEGSIVGLVPTSDGTHSFNAVGDFQYNGTTNMGSTSPTDTYSYLDDPLDNITDFLAVSGAAAGEYLEWNISGMPAATSVNAVEVASAHHSATTTANKQTLRMVDGGSTDDTISDGDQSQTTITYSSKHYATKPSGGAWTQAVLNALKFRWTSSFGTIDITPVPFIDGLCLEVDHVLSFTPARVNTMTQAVHRAASW